MGSVPKLRFVDRTGTPLSPRYHAAMDRLSRSLWLRYPFIRDEAERDNAIEETLRRVASHEQRHGEIRHLPLLLQRIFPQVISSMFMRRHHHSLNEQSVKPQDLDSLAVALSHYSPSQESDVYRRELRDMVKQLDKRDRNVLTLYVRSWTAKQIARELGLTEANVYQIIHRLRDRFSRHYRESR